MKSFIATGCAAALAVSTIAAAQDKAASAYPVKPIRFIVPFAPGGGLDITARLIGQKLTPETIPG